MLVANPASYVGVSRFLRGKYLRGVSTSFSTLSSLAMGSSTPRSFFDKAEFIPPDAIFDVTRRYLADSYANKVNLGQGTYRDEKGQPWILPSVRMAKTEIGECGHEYLPIAGLKLFRDKAVKLAFKGTKALSEDRVSEVTET